MPPKKQQRKDKKPVPKKRPGAGAQAPKAGAGGIVQKQPRFVGSKMLFNQHNGVPPKKRLALRYSETFNLTTGSAGVVGTIQLMRLNSLFDPNQSGTGHQPYLFDTWTAQYDYYRVDAARVELLWNTIGSSADVAGCFTVNPSSTYTSIAGMTLDRAAEIQNVATCTISGSGNTRAVKQVFYLPINKVEGVTKAKYLAEDNYTALVSANPALNVTAAFGAASYSGTGSEAVSVQCVITYYCTMWGRKTQSQS